MCMCVSFWCYQQKIRSASGRNIEKIDTAVKVVETATGNFLRKLVAKLCFRATAPVVVIPKSFARSSLATVIEAVVNSFQAVYTGCL